MNKRNRADSGATRKSATKETTLTAMSVQHDSETVKRSIALLSKLEQSEQMLHDAWTTTQNPDVAYTWLYCVHNLRQVAKVADAEEVTQ